MGKQKRKNSDGKAMSEFSNWWYSNTIAQRKVYKKQLSQLLLIIIGLLICSFTWKPMMIGMLKSGILDGFDTDTEVYDRSYNECMSAGNKTHEQCHDIAIQSISSSSVDYVPIYIPR